MPRSKYRPMAEDMYKSANLRVTRKSEDRLERIADFLRKNRKQAKKAFVTTSKSKVESAQKYKVVGRNNAHKAGQKSTTVYVAIP